ncbi:MAG TPA: hypothetical protein PLI90_13230 [Rhodocyclaceae bacterium]|nr:hypothetical protein [Rhodocyclaceae bacterium]
MSISKETQSFFKAVAHMSELQCDAPTLWNGEVNSPLHHALVESMTMYFEHGYNAYLTRLLSSAPLELRREILAYIVTYTNLKPDLAKILIKGPKVIDSQSALEAAKRTPIQLRNDLASPKKPNGPTKQAYLMAMLLKMEKQLNAGKLIPENEHIEKLFRGFLTKIRASRATKNKAAADFWLDDQETSFSIKAISGGLPSLGKHAK